MKVLSLYFLTVVLSAQISHAQNDTDFAIGYFGLGIQTLPQVNSFDNSANSLSFGARSIGRMSWGGLHFWDHIDFEISFPVSSGENKSTAGGAEYKSVLTAGSTYGFSVNYYPFAIQDGQVRPFVGIGLLSEFRYRQEQAGILSPDYSDDKSYAPLKVGLSYRYSDYLFELGWQELPIREFEYYTSRSNPQKATLDGSSYYFSAKYLFEGTKNDNKKVVKGDYAFTIGVGPSASTSLKRFSYNKASRPWLPDDSWEQPLVLESALGVFFFESELQVALVHRKGEATIKAYNVAQTTSREALSLEVYRYLFNYHGFQPYLGLNLTRDQFAIKEVDLGVTTIDDSFDLVSPGITLGWDIVPTKRVRALLRTNLRISFPSQKLFEGKVYEHTAQQFEFNFIQLVVFI